MYEYQRIKMFFLQNLTLTKKVKDTYQWRYIIKYLNGKEIVGTFYKDELKIC